MIARFVQVPFYWAAWVFGQCFLWALFRPRVVRSAQGLPAGGFVLAANHCSYVDPLLLAYSVRRRVTYMVTTDVYERWFMRPFMWMLGCIPVQESRGNRKALRRAVEALRNGDVVGIFPEGGISRDGRLRSGAPGVASLLLMAEVPVVPVALVGTHVAYPKGRLLPRPIQLEIRHGDAIEMNSLPSKGRSRSARYQLRDRIIRAIDGLLPDEQKALVQDR